MAIERDCNTCKYHLQGRWGGSSMCNLCVTDKELPHWEQGDPLTGRERHDQYLAAIQERHLEMGPGEIVWVPDDTPPFTQQSRKESLLEAFLNTASGFALSYLTWVLIAAPLFNIPVSHTETFGITCVFTVVSILRSYVWRRLFNNGNQVRFR